MQINRIITTTGDASFPETADKSKAPTLNVASNPQEVLGNNTNGSLARKFVNEHKRKETDGVNQRVEGHAKRTQITGFQHTKNNKFRTGGRTPPASPPRIFVGSTTEGFTPVRQLTEKEARTLFRGQKKDSGTNEVYFEDHAKDLVKQIVQENNKDKIDLQGKSILVSTCAEPVYPRANIDHVANQLLNDIWGYQQHITGKISNVMRSNRDQDVLLDGSRQTYNLTVAITEKKDTASAVKKTVWIAANLTDPRGRKEIRAKLSETENETDRKTFFCNDAAKALREAEVVAPDESFDIVYLR